MTITEYIERNYPNNWKSGKWDCWEIGFAGITQSRLKKLIPHGFQIFVKGPQKYWVWLIND